MANSYYSDRTVGPLPRTESEISEATWGGIVVLIRSLLANGAFGYRFPESCPDGEGTCGADARDMGLAIRAEVPDITWPLDESDVPPTLSVLDLIEFCHGAVAEPIAGKYHPFFGHHHLSFDLDAGKEEFRKRINQLFARSALCHELGPEGMVVRTSPIEVSDLLRRAQFRTGDSNLDELLHIARQKYFDPDPRERKTAVEKLWDAWEHLKTLEPGADKNASITALLDRAASEAELLKTLEVEARELTRIGNTFRIRHSETSQVEVNDSAHVDYFFHRLFAFILMLLKRTGRAG